jgi:hypothetical protein
MPVLRSALQLGRGENLAGPQGVIVGSVALRRVGIQAGFQRKKLHPLTRRLFAAVMSAKLVLQNAPATSAVVRKPTLGCGAISVEKGQERLSARRCRISIDISKKISILLEPYDSLDGRKGVRVAVG